MESAHVPPQDQSRNLPLPPLQSSFDKQAYQRLHRPAPALNFPDEQPYGRFPREEPYGLRNNHLPIALDTKAVDVKRRTSRFGLASLFSRTKPSDHEEKQERLGIQWEAEEAEETPKAQGYIETSQQTVQVSFSEEIDALPPIESPATQLRHQTSKPNLRAKSSFKKEVVIKTWDPPPLFQAYPQAVKHATLRAPSLSAESIIRLHTNRNHGRKPRSDLYTPDPHPARDSKEKRLKRNNATDSLSKGDWTHKVFVMVTEGYFLQYAGDGSFDRLPEKIMPLTKESAAFASDVLPGQPYVLQVSQVSDDQGTLDKDASRSMLKKLGLRSEMRRSTSTFFLVLESPEEMNAWLVAVRREIQAMGGKEYNPDGFRNHNTEEPTPTLQQKPSQRYLVKRDPNRFSEKTPQPPFSCNRADNEQLAGTSGEIVATSNPAAVERQSLVTQRSIESRSVSNGTTSIDQVYLDRLKESPRQSYASTAAKTTSTSRGSSPRLSPEKLIFEVPDLSREFAESRPTPCTYPRSAYGSMHKASNANASHRMSMPTTSPKQPSVYIPQHRQTSSPTASNFSVPTFSKRFSISPALSSTTSKIQTPPVTLHHESSSPSIIEGEGGATEKRTSTIGELQHLRRPSPNTARRISSAENNTFRIPPHSSDSWNPPPSSEGEKQFSRRSSSLEYSRGVSPFQLTWQSPSPHPPPTAALPALPRAASPYRASIIPPPITALPPIPSASKLPARYSMLPPSTTSAPTESASEPSSYLADPSPPARSLSASSTSGQASHPSLAAPPASALQPVAGGGTSIGPSTAHRPAQGATKVSSTECRRTRRLVNGELRSDTVADQPPLQSPQTGFKTPFELEGLTPPSDDSPPKPIRKPPPPPPQQGHTQGRRSVPRIGREPPPVYSVATSPRPRISIPSQAESYFDRAAPHPFIPPIRVSERKFRGSLDGPWNPSYGAPQKTFLDLSVG